MAISKEKKNELVAEYTDLLEQSKGLIFTDYRGLTDKDLKRVRHAVREANGQYRVTKLTLFRLALEQAGYPVPDELDGVPVAVGFCIQEVPAVAKALTEFAKESDLMVVKGGIVGHEVMSEAQIKALAELPSMDELRAQIAGLLEAPASGLVGVLQSGVSSVVNVLHAYAEQGEAA